MAIFAGPPPWNGTWVKLALSNWPSQTPSTCPALPSPEEPIVAELGSFFALSLISAMVFTLAFRPAVMPKGCEASWLIGVKSRFGS